MNRDLDKELHPRSVIDARIPIVAREEPTFDPAPLPSLERLLLAAVERHMQSEQESIAGYKEVAARTGDPVIRALMGLVVEDEERHHALLQRLAATVGEDMYWRKRAEALPEGSRLTQKERAWVAPKLRDFARAEQEGARFLRQLARESAKYYGGTVSLVLELLSMDSRKHALILRFLQRLAEKK
jgi:rubrerythrin